jgi:hypothetical protein
MLAHETSQRRVDHGLGDRLEDMQEEKRGAGGLGHHRGSLGHPPTHGGQINSGNDGPQRSSRTGRRL